MTGQSSPPSTPGGPDEIDRTIAFVPGRSGGADPTLGEDASGTVVLAPSQGHLRAGGVPEATLRLEHHGVAGHAVAGHAVAGPLEATLLLRGSDLAVGGALPPATMVLGDRHDGDPTTTVAMRTSDGAPLAATMRLPEAGLPHTAVGSHGGATVQVDAAAYPVGPSPASAPFVPMAEPSMAVPPASTSGSPAARARLGPWMAIGTLVAAIAGVVVGLLLSGG